MQRPYFLKTGRLGFSNWKEDDTEFARMLWGDPAVAQYICARGKFTEKEIQDRLQSELNRQKEFQVQYWPVFDLNTGDFVGCCGLRPYSSEQADYEIGVHLRPEYWGKGVATEAARAVINFAFGELGAKNLFAGHNPNNSASKRLLAKLGFQYIRDEFYEPTGLYHPSYLYYAD